MTARRRRPSPAAIAAVEPLVRAVYDQLYGPRRWESMSAPVRGVIVDFVIDCARTGASRCIVHTQPDGTEHAIAPATVLAALNEKEPTNA